MAATDRDEGRKPLGKHPLRTAGVPAEDTTALQRQQKAWPRPAVLAARLSEDRERSVLLLEAGPDYPQFEQLLEEIKFGFDAGTGAPPLRTPGGHSISLLTSMHNWQFIAQAPDEALPMPVPMGKIAGGSSAINSSAFYRGVPEDFEGWAS